MQLRVPPKIYMNVKIIKTETTKEMMKAAIADMENLSWVWISNAAYTLTFL